MDECIAPGQGSSVTMEKQRLEAFSDGTLAIIITIMVLELKVPHDYTWEALAELWPTFISYILSFIFVGVFWYNHHLVFSKVTTVDSYVLWLNLAGLFLQSLLPFATAWMGETGFQSAPVALYAVINGLTAILIIPLVLHLRKLHGPDSEFSKKIRNVNLSYATIVWDFSAAFVAAIGFPMVGFVMMVSGAIFWFFPNLVFRLRHTKQ